MRAGATKTAAVIRWPLQTCSTRLALLGGASKELSPSGGGRGGLQAYREPHRRAPYGAESSIFYSRRGPEQHRGMMMMISIVVQTRWNPISTGGSRLENAMARLARSTQRHLKLAMLACTSVEC